jgi:hypothetical protein
MDALSLLLPIFILTISIPFLKDVLFDQGWDTGLAKWMAGHLVHTSPESNGFMNLVQATPVGQGMGLEASAVAQRFYDLFLLGMMVAAVFVGLQMILRVYETIWRDAHGVWQSKPIGGVLGLGIGVTISTYVVSVLGLSCWIRGMEWLDGELIDSLFVQLVYRVIS